MLIRARTLRALSVHRSSRFLRFLTTSITHTPLQDGTSAAHLSFTGPKKYPILDPEATTTLTQAILNITSQPGIRALFLRSTIAGADLKHMSQLTTPHEARSFINLIDRLCVSIQHAPIPVIAVISGPCLGAGLEVAASCDFRIASPGQNTTFGMPETRVGIPSVVQACLLPGIMGWSRAREVLYFGETFSVEEALRWGFLNEVVDEGDGVDECLQKWGDRVARTGREALRLQKELVRRWEDVGVGRQGVEAGVEAFGRAFEGDEPVRMMKLFFEVKSKERNRTSS